MRVRGKATYANILDIPEATSGKVSIRHMHKPAGTVLRSGNLRTQIYGQKAEEITFDLPTRWHELSEEGHGVWMTDLPIEQRQTDEMVPGAHGRVLVGGLGVGYAVVALARKRSVTEIVVIERSPDIIRLVADATRATIDRQHRPAFGPKKAIQFVEVDLFDYLHAGPLAHGTFDWGLYDIWQSDGERTFHSTVLPLRQASAGMVREVVCWNEDVMRGQMLQGLQSRWALLQLARVESEDVPMIPVSLDALCTPNGSYWTDWAVPFWTWYRDGRAPLSKEGFLRAAATYARYYGYTGKNMQNLLDASTWRVLVS